MGRSLMAFGALWRWVELGRDGLEAGLRFFFGLGGGFWCLLERWLEEGERFSTTHFGCFLEDNPFLNFRLKKQYSGATDQIILNKLDVLCQLHEEGCEWFGCINDFKV